MFRLQLCFSSHTCCIVFQILYKVPDFNICCITVNDFLSLYAILYCFHSSKQCETLVYIKCLLGMSNSYYFCFKLKLCDAIVVDTVVHLHNCSNFFIFFAESKSRSYSLEIRYFTTCAYSIQGSCPWYRPILAHAWLRIPRKHGHRKC